MENSTSDTNLTTSSSVKERLMRRLNESEDKTGHFFCEGTSIPFGITFSTFLSKDDRGEVEAPSGKQSVPPSS